MKWILTIGTLLYRHFSSSTAAPASFNPMDELKDFLKDNAKKVSFGIFSVISLSMLFISGILITTLGLTYQWDSTGTLVLTSTVIAGIVMIFISGTTCYFIFRTSDHEDKVVPAKREKVAAPGPQAPLIQEAIALLITDFVKEREAHREAQMYQHPPQIPSENRYN